ncbi:hypothetical protein CQY20_11550 [Mycolicibacterium agri]|uniref:Lipopolysaccharide assembly protein A domain-containing protein n=1 Tax=Mycolicibacterium agri TaxID=36811 RepID=A0A2A7N5Q4_MYCAG|nr:lipopolysaccharide assembly protein LapA domain-containing protein [Mycolicibacterium agri]PEG39169.1 hypothetical protein CQY20_11550 [Mycolicibacterium agri]GFG53893.1 hypothetical protein MAGR_53340 [Mycolicibacterium agri]
MTSDPSMSPDQPSDATSPVPADHLPAESSVPPAMSKPVTSKPKDSASTFTRAGALWTALIVGFLILILLLVFILQNTASTTIHFFGWEWILPVGVALLFAAVCGGLLTVAAGTVRIVQLRRAAKKNLKSGL